MLRDLTARIDGTCPKLQLLLGFAVVEGTEQQTIELLVDKPCASTGDVDDLPNQVGIHPGDKVVQVYFYVVPIVAELGGVVIAQVLWIQMLKIGAGVNKQPATLRHFAAGDRDKAVGMDFCRRTVPSGIKHGRPEQTVKVDDVFANEMVQLGIFFRIPKVLENNSVGLVCQVAKARHVADRGVHPDIEILVGGAGNQEPEVGGIAGDVPGFQPRIQPLGEFVGDFRLQGSRSRPGFQEFVVFG